VRYYLRLRGVDYMAVVMFQYKNEYETIEHKIEQTGKTWVELLDSFYHFLNGIGYKPNLQTYLSINKEKCLDDTYMKTGKL